MVVFLTCRGKKVGVDNGMRMHMSIVIVLKVIQFRFVEKKVNY